MTDWKARAEAAEARAEAAEAQNQGLLDAIERLNETDRRRRAALEVAGLEGAEVLVEQKEAAEGERDRLREALDVLSHDPYRRLLLAEIEKCEESNNQDLDPGEPHQPPCAECRVVLAALSPTDRERPDG